MKENKNKGAMQRIASFNLKNLSSSASRLGECMGTKMDKIENLENIVVLIDADNAQLTKLKLILDEISAYGRIVVKKAYGDWNNPALKNWEKEVKQLAIKPEQQFAYTTGKNASDISLVIGAMDLLYTKMYDAFVLISSDSDYTPLAIRLREAGVYVFGAGEDHTPDAFRNACDNFILTQHLADNTVVKSDKAPESPTAASISLEHSGRTNINDVHKLLKKAHNLYGDSDGWVNASIAGAYIKRVKSDFDTKMYGYVKLTELLKAFPNKYKTKTSPGKGTSKIFAYKCL